MTLTSAEERVASVPWEALTGLGPLLDEPLRHVLEGSAAERVLDTVLRANRSLSADQRQVVAESVFGVGLWRRRLRALHSREASPRELLATLVNDLGQRAHGFEMLQVRTKVLNRFSDWRDRHSVPDWLAVELEGEFAAAAETAAAALNEPGPICLRPNTLKTTRDELARVLEREGILTRPGQHSSEALVITSPARPNLYGTAASAAALFEVQDEGSQLLGQSLGAQPGDEVLDLCAGAGGKSLQLAGHVAPEGRVHAFDIDPAKLARLRHRAERAGAAIAVHSEIPAKSFDRILCDAPCSELGALRRGPDLRWRIDPATFAHLFEINLQLCRQALSLLKPGGRLVYATCTFRRAENEAVVEALGIEPSKILKVAPHTHGTDGFFAAVFNCP